ncbi:MAG: hypothetical protein LBM96_07015 [Methanobrevibacter sp.]|nr:hypothetical protein [Candidatus Methanoflexus mossambicus]
MDLRAKLEERVSKEGKPYVAIIVRITDTYEKLIFLDKAELELLKLTYGNSQKIKISNPQQ